MVDLKSCPFCASAELIDDGYKIECKHCNGRSGFRTSLHREAWNTRAASRATPADHALDPAIETLTRENSALEQQLSQAGDNIELAEAEQRGFERGKKSAESALREAQAQITKLTGAIEFARAEGFNWPADPFAPAAASEDK